MPRFLTFLALAAVLYMGYEWWNAREPDPVALPAPAPAASVQPAAPVAQPRGPFQPVSEPPKISAPVQMVNPGILMEGTPHAARLNGIRQALEKGNVAEVEARLMTLPKDAPDDPVARKFIADIWNNLGVIYAGTSGLAAGVKAFQTAVSLDPEGPRAHVNLLHALWELKEPGLSPELIEKTVALAPEEPLPHLLLADIFQTKGEMKSVAEQLDLAAEHAGQNPKLQAFVKEAAARIKRDLKAGERSGGKDSPAPPRPGNPG